MSRHHIAGSEVGRSIAPGNGAMRLYAPRRPGGGLLHTASSFLAIIGLIAVGIALARAFGG